MGKIAKHYKPYTFLIIFTILLIFLQSFSELFLPESIRKIIDIGIINKDYSFILYQGLIMILIIVVSALAQISVGYCSSKLASSVSRDLRNNLFIKAENFSLNEFDQFGTSSLITRTTNDITQVQMFTAILLRVIVMAPVMSIGGVIMAFTTNASLAKYVLLAMPVIIITISIVAKKTIPLLNKQQKKVDSLNQITRENLTGMRVIKAFLKTDYEINRFDEANKDLTKISITAHRLMGGLMPALMLIMNIISVVITFIGADIIAKGNMEVGALVAFSQYVMQIMFSLLMLSMVFVSLPRAIVSANRINEVLDTKNSVLDGNITKTKFSKKGYVEFDNVSFTYPNADSPVIKNISFQAKPGETTALIGSTGSGKSTIINLIPRFYDVTSGRILVDGIDIRDYTQKTLRDKIGFVPQKGVLFSGTIEENLKLGNENATEDDLIKAATIAQAIEFINEKPDKFNEHIAQGGTNVSGGQKQRLAIARAIIKKPEIYIFDDSFSALDFKTDALLRKALKEETKESTVLIVAQRVSSILDADTIICLNEGEICGMGSHKELLKNCQVYREIVESQLSKEEIEHGN